MSRNDEIFEELGPKKNGAAEDYVGRKPIRPRRRPVQEDTQPCVTIAPEPMPEAVTVRARVKHYNVAKGFGFLADAPQDIFFHVSVLKPHNRSEVAPGAVLECEVGYIGDQRRVTRVLSIDDTNASPLRMVGRAGRFAGTRSDWERATFKWFNESKGYGFFTRHDGVSNLFVHASVLETNGFTDLEAGEMVEVRHMRTEKGLAVVDIRLIPNP